MLKRIFKIVVATVLIMAMSYGVYIVNEERVQLEQRITETEKVQRKQLEYLKEVTKQLKEVQEILFKMGLRDYLFAERLETFVRKVKIIIKVLQDFQLIDEYNEETIRKANFTIYNKTVGCLGSGTHIKVEGKSFVLTCAHLVKEENDLLLTKGDDKQLYVLELIKINRKKDLALLTFPMNENLPHLEISEVEPKVGSKVLLIGNPGATEDMLTEGIIAKIYLDGYMLTNKSFFGNSGGALLYRGKVVGVLQKGYYLTNGRFMIHYGYACNLKAVNNFLEGV